MQRSVTSYAALDWGSPRQMVRELGRASWGRAERVLAAAPRRLPTLAAVATDPATAWASVGVADWYGAGERTVELASATAVWYHSGLPPVPLRWVLIRDPRGQFDTRALLCTDPDAAAERILAWFVRRWQLEV